MTLVYLIVIGVCFIDICYLSVMFFRQREGSFTSLMTSIILTSKVSIATTLIIKLIKNNQ